MQSIILHLDMNSYFASVIQQDHPEYRGRPLGVCEHLGGIIIGASKEAKKWGITTGTPVWEARKLYPKIVLTHTAAERFRYYTRRLIKLVSEYTDKLEVYSIDEVFINITRVCNIRIPRLHLPSVRADGGQAISNFSPSAKATEDRQFSINFQSASRRTNFKNQKAEIARFIQARKNDWTPANPWEEAVNIALDIKKRMKSEVGDWLTCSIGIAENKVLAKIASDMRKPDGLIVIVQSEKRKAQNIPAGCLFFTKDDLYYRLKLIDVPGIGSRMETRLNSLGIRTLLDLKNYPKSKLVALFGVPGHHVYNLGQLSGDLQPALDRGAAIKSMGHAYTLPKEYRRQEFFEPVLFKLCEMVGRRLRRKNLEGNILHFYIYPDTKSPEPFSSGLNGNWSKDKEGFNHKFKGFGVGVYGGHQQSWGKARRLGFFIDDGREIFRQAMEVYRCLNIKAAAFKLIGVSVSGLKEKDGQRSLFGTEERRSRLVSSLDKINDKYGDFTIIRAPVLAAGKVFRDSVGFGRVKEL